MVVAGSKGSKINISQVRNIHILLINEQEEWLFMKSQIFMSSLIVHFDCRDFTLLLHVSMYVNGRSSFSLSIT